MREVGTRGVVSEGMISEKMVRGAWLVRGVVREEDGREEDG